MQVVAEHAQQIAQVLRATQNILSGIVPIRHVVAFCGLGMSCIKPTAPALDTADAL